MVTVILLLGECDDSLRDEEHKLFDWVHTMRCYFGGMSHSDTTIWNGTAV